MIRFTVPGHPVGKGRARSTLRGFKTKATGKRVPIIGHYTPEKTRAWEGRAAKLALGARRGMPLIAGPVRLELEILHAVPDGWPLWKKALALAGAVLPTVKPDGDNVEKAVKDALNGVLWADDVQVVDAAKSKRYAAEPGVRITVTPLPGFPAQITRKPTIPSPPVEA